MRVPRLLVAGAVLLGVSVSWALAQAPLPVLADPVKIMAGGKPIAVDIGHAAPLLIDINRDGKPDLLVGQFGGGKCRVYLNRGTAEQPRFDDFTYLQADGADATVPPS
jgi:hypothetical protein